MGIKDSVYRTRWERLQQYLIEQYEKNREGATIIKEAIDEVLKQEKKETFADD